MLLLLVVLLLSNVFAWLVYSGKAELCCLYVFACLFARFARISQEFHRNFTRISPEVAGVHVGVFAWLPTVKGMLRAP